MANGNAEQSGSVRGLLPSVAGLCFMRDYSRLKRLKIAISNENSHDYLVKKSVKNWIRLVNALFKKIRRSKNEGSYIR